MDILNRIFGINYRTSILGIGVIVAAGGRVLMAFRSKNYDFPALAEDGQLIMNTAAALLAGWGLLIAKDNSVTGVGGSAKVIDSAGTVTNVAGVVVGHQPTVAEVTK